MKKTLCMILTLALALCLCVPAAASEGFRYRHDPRLNPSAMADVVADETAIYGFRPSETGSLKQYAAADWSDPGIVAQGRAERIAYHESLEAMYGMLDELRAEGQDIETIARAISAKRNELRMAAYDGDPEGLAIAKERNLERYGHEEGPLPDELYAQYGSWETVLAKAFSANSGMDACLGLYDDYHSVYVELGQIAPEGETDATRAYVVAALVDALAPAGESGGAALSDFADAEEIGAAYLPEWERAAACGLVRGYEDHTLRPGQTVRRVEALALLSRCLKELTVAGEPLPFADVPDWARAEIDRLSAAGLVPGAGDGKLGADDPLTVEQVSILLERVKGL